MNKKKIKQIKIVKKFLVLEEESPILYNSLEEVAEDWVEGITVIEVKLKEVRKGVLTMETHTKISLK